MQSTVRLTAVENLGTTQLVHPLTQFRKKFGVQEKQNNNYTVI